MAVESIAKTLGSGSGIDLSALVTSLVDAQYAVKNNQFEKRAETLTTQISAVSELKSGMTSFAAALQSLVTGGSLATQPTSGNTAIVTATALSGSNLANLSASVEVQQLAAGQVTSGPAIADRSAAIGTGTLTLTFGTAAVSDGDMTGFVAGGGTPVDIAIASGNHSLTGIAAAINAKKAGVTASIITDGADSRLVLKSATGATQAFTLTATEDVGAEGLASLNIGVGSTGSVIATTAKNAIVAVDGIVVERASNSISNLIDGVRLDLIAATPGTPVSIGNSRPTSALRQAVGDVVSTYNELLAILKAATDPVSGTLRGDPAANQMKRSLAQITLTPLITGAASGTPKTLAEIGITTNRDGTLSVASARLETALSTYPDSVEAMFARGTGASGAGLAAALNAIADLVTSKTTGLGASETRYTSAQTTLSDEQAKALDAAESLRTRMTQQFASMDAKVAAYKSTQSFLEQQVDAWNAN